MLLDIYNLNVSKLHLNSIKDSLDKFKLNNPEQQCVSCISYMKSSKYKLEIDLKNHTFDSLYEEAQNEEVKNSLRTIITLILNTFLNSYTTTDVDFVIEAWINMVCYEQEYTYNSNFHNHYQMNLGNVISDKSIIFYIQMPNNLQNDDGVLFYEDEDKVKLILPKNGQMIVMDSKTYHVPNIAPFTTIDRIVLGINIKLL